MTHGQNSDVRSRAVRAMAAASMLAAAVYVDPEKPKRSPYQRRDGVKHRHCRYGWGRKGNNDPQPWFTTEGNR